jgi:hypothetical protein
LLLPPSLLAFKSLHISLNRLLEQYQLPPRQKNLRGKEIEKKRRIRRIEKRRGMTMRMLETLL